MNGQENVIYTYDGEVSCVPLSGEVPHDHGVEENERIGAMIAAAANASAAPVTILLPLGGVSMLDSEGGVLANGSGDDGARDLPLISHSSTTLDNIPRPGLAPNTVALRCRYHDLVRP